MSAYDQITGEDFNGELCPQAQAIVDSFPQPTAAPIEAMDIQAARDNHALEAFDITIASSKTQVEDRQIELKKRSLRVRIYSPEGEGPFPILSFAHGGCWTFCSIESHDHLCHYYAHHANCVVVSVDYALAPEHPFPQGLDDFYDATLWCFENASALNGDATRVAVAGDSAGGNLAAVVAQRLQTHSHYRLSLQLLIYPICDASQLVGGSMERYAKNYFFTHDVFRWTASLYAKDNPLETPEISPLYGKVSTQLAPSVFLIAECDILRDQALAYAERLREVGADVRCDYYRGVPHAFIAMAGKLKLGERALKKSAQTLKHAFTQSQCLCRSFRA